MTTTPSVVDLLRTLSRALNERGTNYALIGGLALGPRGYARATTDVDFLVHEAFIEDTRELMRSRNATIIAEDLEFSSYFDSKVRCDFQHARREISQGMLSRAGPVEFAWGERVPVIQAEDLIGLKIQAFNANPRRLKDLVDIQELMKANWGRLDLDRVRTWFLLFDRERDFNGLLRLAAPDR